MDQAGGFGRTWVSTLLGDGFEPVALEEETTTGLTGPTADGGTEEPTQEAPSERYERICLLGMGGMGEVWRVRDPVLNRTMAMKIIRPELARRAQVLARFVEEAQCSAQLQHPGIVPVHELGQLPDGRVWFTMREVRGRTLAEVIAEVHAGGAGPRLQAGASSWTFRRLVDAFHRVCEAMSYAHGRGAIHRDLKPENIMLGAHGEALVLDWGLAKIARRAERAPADPDEVDEEGDDEQVITERSRDRSQATRLGAVAGTPAYMPPEQARGEVDRIDARSDVYALGAILYELLSGRPPYRGADTLAVLDAVIAGPPPPPGEGLPVALPEELVAACQKAMAREPAQRFADARGLAQEISAWLEGARRREQALELVDRALALDPSVQAQVDRARGLRATARGALAALPPWAPEEEKLEAWALEDEAAQLERQADLLDLRVEQGLAAALRIDPTLPEAHAALAERHRAAHAAAEAAQEAEKAARLEIGLAEHVAALPPAHAVARRCRAWLEGAGALTLVTDPPGATVDLYRFEPLHRRLQPVFERCLGQSPLDAVRLPMGSYLCRIQHPDRAPVLYPVHIGRQEHWDGQRPGDRSPFPVRLPRREELGPDDCYVPAGMYLSGGDAGAAVSLPRRRLWCDGFVMKRFPVTNREYLRFLDDLVAAGRQDEALRWVPRERPGQAGEEGAIIYGRDPDGRFVLRADADGDLWDPDWPVIQVDWAGARAYGQHQSALTGQAWGLPGELEWQKAARGVDGRVFPWGDFLDLSWCCLRDSKGGRGLLDRVDSFPVDQSVYGVRGLAGNVTDWCADAFHPEGPPTDGGRVLAPDRRAQDAPGAYRTACGGSWSNQPAYARLALRSKYVPSFRCSYLGFRLVRNLA